MIIYGEIKKSVLYIDYKKLAEKMWFKVYKGQSIGTLGQIGGSLQLQTLFMIDLSLPKWIYDDRWRQKKLTAEYVGVRPFDIPEMSMLVFSTDHKKSYTLDQRALFVLVIEIMSQVGGRISVDDQKSWLTVEEFQHKYEAIINLTFEEANEISLKESETIVVEDEPWEEKITDYDDNYLVSFAEKRERKALSFRVKPKDLSVIINRTELIDKMWPGISLDQLHVINTIDIPWVHDPFTLGFQNISHAQGFQHIEGNFKIPKYNMIDTFGAEDDYIISVYTNHFEFSEGDYYAFYTMLHEVIKLTDGQVAVNVENQQYQWQSLAGFETEFAEYLE